MLPVPLRQWAFLSPTGLEGAGWCLLMREGRSSEMRRDTVELIRQAVREERRAYVLVNNRSEGNAPLTVQALVDRLHTGN